MANKILSTTGSVNSWIATVPIANGGTGAATQSAALTAILGSSLIPITNGGTGTNLGNGTLSQLIQSNANGTMSWSSSYLHQQTRLTNAQSRTLSSVPIILLPVVSNVFYLIQNAVIQLIFNTASFTAVASTLRIAFGAGGTPLATIASSAFTAGQLSGSVNVFSHRPADSLAPVNSSTQVGLPIYLSATADLVNATSGASFFVVDLYYTTLTMG